MKNELTVSMQRQYREYSVYYSLDIRLYKFMMLTPIKTETCDFRLQASYLFPLRGQIWLRVVEEYAVTWRMSEEVNPNGTVTCAVLILLETFRLTR